jgi:hypothetical protein
MVVMDARSAARSFGLAAMLLAAASARGATPGNPAPRKPPPPFIVRGEVVELSCYLADGRKRGEAHEACAREGIAAGRPAGILTRSGTVYLAIGKDVPASELLAPYAAKRVRVSGQRVSRGKLTAILVDSVEALPPEEPKPAAKTKKPVPKS